MVKGVLDDSMKLGTAEESECFLNSVRCLRFLSGDQAQTMTLIALSFPTIFFEFGANHLKKQCISLLAKKLDGDAVQNSTFKEFIRQTHSQVHNFFDNLDILLSCAKKWTVQAFVNEELAIFDTVAFKLRDIITQKYGAVSEVQFTHAVHVTSKLFIAFEDRMQIMRVSEAQSLFSRTKNILTICTVICKTYSYSASVLNAVGLTLSCIFKPWSLPAKSTLSCVSKHLAHTMRIDESSASEDLLPQTEIQIFNHNSYDERFFETYARNLTPQAALCVIHGCLQRFELCERSNQYTDLLIDIICLSKGHQNVEFQALLALETMCGRLLKLPPHLSVTGFLKLDQLTSIEKRIYEIWQHEPAHCTKIIEKILAVLSQISQKYFVGSKVFHYDHILSAVPWNSPFKYSALEALYGKKIGVRSFKIDALILENAVLHTESPKTVSPCARLLVLLASSNHDLMKSIFQLVNGGKLSKTTCRILISKVLAPLAEKKISTFNFVFAKVSNCDENAGLLLASMDKRCLNAMKVNQHILQTVQRVVTSADSKARFECMSTFLEIGRNGTDGVELIGDFICHNIRLENVFHQVEIESLMKRLKARAPESYSRAVDVFRKQLHPVGGFERRFSLLQFFRSMKDSHIDDIPLGVLISTCFENWRDLRRLSYSILIRRKSEEVSQRMLAEHEARLFLLLTSVKQTHSDGAAYLLTFSYIKRWEALPALESKRVALCDIGRIQATSSGKIEEMEKSHTVTATGLHGYLHLLKLLSEEFISSSLFTSKKSHEPLAFQKENVTLCTRVLSIFVRSCENKYLEEEKDFEYDCRGHIISHNYAKHELQELSAFAWLCLKESAELLENSVKSAISILTPKDIQQAINGMTQVLLSSKHNGVISKCHSSLTQIYRTSLSHGSEAIRMMPQKSLDFAFGENGVCSASAMRTLRRSQGLPFTVLAVVESELSSLSKQLFPECIAKIVSILQNKYVIHTPPLSAHETAKLVERRTINTLNVLKQLMSTSTLHGAIKPYIENIFGIIYYGIENPSWAIRNSFIMTYSKLLTCFIDDNPVRRPTVCDILERYPSIIDHISEKLSVTSGDEIFLAIMVLERIRPLDFPSKKHENILIFIMEKALMHAGAENILLRHAVARVIRNIACVNISKTTEILMKRFQMLLQTQYSVMRVNALHTYLLCLTSIFSLHHTDCAIAPSNDIMYSLTELLFINQSENLSQYFQIQYDVLKFLISTKKESQDFWKPLVTRLAQKVEEIYLQTQKVKHCPQLQSLVSSCVETIIKNGSKSDAQSIGAVISQYAKNEDLLGKISDHSTLAILLENDSLRYKLIPRCRNPVFAEALLLYYTMQNSSSTLQADINSIYSTGGKFNLFTLACSLIAEESLCIEWELKAVLIKVLTLLYNKNVVMGSQRLGLKSLASALSHWSQPDHPEIIRLSVATSLMSLKNAFQETYKSFGLCQVVTRLLSDNSVKVRHRISAFISGNVERPTLLQTDVCKEHHYLAIAANKTYEEAILFFLETILPSMDDIKSIAVKQSCEDHVFDSDEPNFYAESLHEIQYTASILRYAAQEGRSKWPLEENIRNLIEPLTTQLVSFDTSSLFDEHLFHVSHFWNIIYRLLIFGWVCFPLQESASNIIFTAIKPLVQLRYLKEILGDKILQLFDQGVNMKSGDALFMLSKSYMGALQIN